jgi:hypothetical protein
MVQVEELERRDAPATLVDPMTVTYQDLGGERVRVTISKPLFQAASINSVFTFNAGSVNGDNSLRQQLLKIDLTGLAAGGVSLSVAARGGDDDHGHADVGFINAAGIDLADVFVGGDLGRIDAGNLTGLHSLTAESLGHVLAPGGDVSHIQGRLGQLEVEGDVAGASVLVSDGLGGVAGTMGLVRVDGSVLGAAGDGSGVISSAGTIDRVVVGHDIRGGAGTASGVIHSGERISLVHVEGSLIGGSGDGSGQISTGTAGGTPGAPESTPATDCGLGAVTIEDDVRGGAGTDSGAILNNSLAAIDSVRLGGSLRGGNGRQSGRIFSGGDIGPVWIEGDVAAATGQPVGGQPPGVQSAVILSLGSIAAVHVEGSLLGGDGNGSGQIVAQDLPIQGVIPSGPGGLGPVTIGHDIRGGAGRQSGIISGAGLIASVKLGGSLIGGKGDESGQIVQASAGDGSGIGLVDIEHSIKGGDGFHSGSLVVADSVAQVTVRGSLIGGGGEESGQVASTGDLGAVSIHDDLRGGMGFESGAVLSNGQISSVDVGGSVVGGDGDSSAEIHSDGAMGQVKVEDDVRGGRGLGSANISGSATMASVVIDGSLLGGAGDSSGRIDSAGSLGTVAIEHDVRGGAGAGSAAIHAGRLITLATLGGSLRGGLGDGSGQIAVDDAGRLGTVTIKHNVRGGNGFQSGAILGGTALQALTVGGSLRSGGGNQSASIVAGHLGTLSVDGSIVGTAAHPVLISAPGGLRQVVQTVLRAVPQTEIRTVTVRVPTAGCEYVLRVIQQVFTVVRIIPVQRVVLIRELATLDSLTVGRRVKYANIVAGAGGQIGVIHVHGDWIASSVAAGIGPGRDGYFGTADDTVLLGGVAGQIGTINQIVIDGQASGTPPSVSATDHFGFVAQEIKAFSVHGVSFALQPGPGNDEFNVGTTGDLTLHELP